MEDCNILDCNLYEAITIIKGRWTMFILYELEQAQTFSYLHSRFLFLTNAQLSRSLKQLIEFNLIIKKDNKYHLTTKAVSLLPILDQLEDWYTINFGSIEQ